MSQIKHRPGRKRESMGRDRFPVALGACSDALQVTGRSGIPVQYQSREIPVTMCDQLWMLFVSGIAVGTRSFLLAHAGFLCG